MLVDACALDDLVESRLRLVELDGREIVLARWGDEVYAMRNRCPHQGAALCAGHVIERLAGSPSQPGRVEVDDDSPVVVCPWHRWEFDVRTGRALLSASMRLRMFPTAVVAGRVQVDLQGRV